VGAQLLADGADEILGDARRSQPTVDLADPLP
jgi:hypothetical protein